jgi:hypothetical protein
MYTAQSTVCHYIVRTAIHSQCLKKLARREVDQQNN